MPAIVKVPGVKNTIKKIHNRDDVRQVRIPKSISEVCYTPESGIIEVKSVRLSQDVIIYLDGKKLSNIEGSIDYSINLDDNTITLYKFREGQKAEIIQTIDKPEDIGRTPLMHSENILSKKSTISLPWRYNNIIRNIIVFKNGSLVDSKEYNCTSSTLIEFLSPLNPGDKVSVFSYLPSIDSDLYGKFFNVIPYGTSILFHGKIAPPGFLEKNGNEILRETYKEAFSILEKDMISDNDWNSDVSNKSSFSLGDGSTTFRLPLSSNNPTNTIECVKMYSSVISSADVDIPSLQNEVSNLREEFRKNKPFRNIIINGDMSTNTREDDSQDTGSKFMLDRWFMYLQGTKASMKRSVSTVGSTSHYTADIRVISVRGGSNGAALIYKLGDISKYSGKTLTYSFGMSSGMPSDISFELFMNYGDDREDRGLFTKVIKVNKEFQRYSVSFTVPKVNKDLLDNNFIGICLWLDAGDSIINAGGVGQKSENYLITDVQLELGTVASEFESIPEELTKSMCRYYCRKYHSKMDPRDLQYEMRRVPREIGSSPYIYDSEL